MITYNLRDALADIAGFTVDHVALYNAAKPTSQLIAAVITQFLAAREQESGAHTPHKHPPAPRFTSPEISPVPQAPPTTV